MQSRAPGSTVSMATSCQAPVRLHRTHPLTLSPWRRGGPSGSVLGGEANGEGLSEPSSGAHSHPGVQPPHHRAFRKWSQTQLIKRRNNSQGIVTQSSDPPGGSVSISEEVGAILRRGLRVGAPGRKLSRDMGHRQDPGEQSLAGALGRVSRLPQAHAHLQRGCRQRLQPFSISDAPLCA